MRFSALFSGFPLAADTQVGSTSWLVVGWGFVAIGVVSALAILTDVLRGYRQQLALIPGASPLFDAEDLLSESARVQDFR